MSSSRLERNTKDDCQWRTNAHGVGYKARLRQVRVTSNSPTTHTRVLKYTCNHIGPIKAQHGIHVFADANALGCHEGEQTSTRFVFGRKNSGAMRFFMEVRSI